MTASPGPMRSASRTSTIASVPFATPTASPAPRYSAASRSKAATLGPRMNSASASTPSIASRIRGRGGSYWAFTSTSGIGGTARKSRGTQSSVDPEGQDHQDCGDNDVLDVAEVVVEALVAPSSRPADARKREGPDRRADRRQDRVAPEAHLEDPGRNRDERADDGRDPSDQDREIIPAVEPALGPLELVVAEVEPASAVLEEWPPPIDPDCPTGDGAGEVAKRSGECNHDVG